MAHPHPALPSRGSRHLSLDELARRAAELAKAARPHVERLVAQSKPVVEQATQRTLGYMREHEDELRDVGLSLARLRLGALGFVVDALKGQAPAPRLCPRCQAENAPAARFCNQCGSALTSA